VLKLDTKLRRQLINMIKRSSNRDATAVLERIGMERLQAILQDPRYGKLYDPEAGGGLWVGRPYGKGGKTRRDPIKRLSHGASAMQVARLYYGLITGSILGNRHDDLLREMFGDPAIQHKFVKGLQGRKDVTIYRKSGTWRDFHGDAAVVVRDGLSYIVVAIVRDKKGNRSFVKGIQIVDDVMLKRATRGKDKKP
jgi:beta-lactamase class A